MLFDCSLLQDKNTHTHKHVYYQLSFCFWTNTCICGNHTWRHCSVDALDVIFGMLNTFAHHWHHMHPKPLWVQWHFWWLLVGLHYTACSLSKPIQPNVNSVSCELSKYSVCWSGLTCQLLSLLMQWDWGWSHLDDPGAFEKPICEHSSCILSLLVDKLHTAALNALRIGMVRFTDSHRCIDLKRVHLIQVGICKAMHNFYHICIGKKQLIYISRCYILLLFRNQ